MTKGYRNLLQQEPRLIERYVRLRMHKTARRVSRFIMRRVLPIKERKKERLGASTLAEFAKQAAKSRRYGFESSAVLFNLALFFLIAERDIQTVKIDALTHPNPWKRSLCARVILLTIHGLDMDKVAGRQLQKALADAGVSEEGKRQAAKALRVVRSVHQKAQKQFDFLRNATIAHRDSDALLQYRAITEIDETAVFQIAGEFYDSTHLFISILSDLLLQVGTIPGLLNQLRVRACSSSNPNIAIQPKSSAIIYIALDKITFLEGTIIEGSLEVDNERKLTAKCITTLPEGSNIIVTLSRVVSNLKPGYTYPTLGQDKKEVGKEGKITFGPFTDGGKGHLSGNYQIKVDCYKPGYSFGEFERLAGYWIVTIK